ncbi:MAG TPA: acetolactate synthase small subunit [Christensenellaceae bacterium]|jgi:acetolactate synthase-1/3 small subunit|nr:acetolactate synthase small subunit [Christensenellaceae bacterium]
MEDKFTLSILVNNEAGVLTRVSSLFGRRGYNIDSLSVGETEDPSLARMTILSRGDIATRDQIIKQLQKLVDVKVVQLMEPDNTVIRELMLIKVNAELATRAQIHQVVDVFRAKVVNLSTTNMTIEITGEKSKLDAFVSNLVPYGILELCRTGITAIGRNSDILNNIESEEK